MLNAIPHVWSHQMGVEGDNHLPQPADCTALNAAPDAVGSQDCECSLPGYVELLVHQWPQVLLDPFSTQPEFVLRVAICVSCCWQMFDIKNVSLQKEDAGGQMCCD